LEKNRKKRLGSNGGVDEILAHPFFEPLNIQKLLLKELEPPYKPDIGDDLKFFDQMSIYAIIENCDWRWNSTKLKLIRLLLLFKVVVILLMI
jgi:hypothetical protein